MNYVRTVLSPLGSVTFFVKAHPILASLLAIALAGGGYWSYGAYMSTDGEAQYILAPVKRGELVVTVSGSGQVSAENEITLTAGASGDIVSLPVKNGEVVKAGTLIAQIDAREAQKAVRDAEVNLESAKLALQKLKQPPTALELTQKKNALIDADNTLAKAYGDGFNEVSDTFLGLPAVMSGLDDILNDNTVNGTQDNAFAYADMIDDIDPHVIAFRDDAINRYKEARAAYDTALVEYKAASRFSDETTVEKLILDTYEMTKTVAEAAKSVSDLLNLVNDSLVIRDRIIPAILTTHRASLSTYIGDTNAQLVALFALKDTITSSKQNIAESTEALRDLEDGADPLDIASQELTVKQRQNSLLDARELLADYSVRAPFDGTVAKLEIQRWNTVSNGATVATFITAQQIAEISLNEIDAAGVHLGQKAKLTFDAVEALEIGGEVVEIDTVGTVASGVVTYTVTIGFSTDARVKPGMTVNADIITNTISNVLVVPSSAVKSERDSSYVETLSNTNGTKGPVTSETTPVRVLVTAGISNDTEVEIVSGLNEGDMIIVRTISGTSAGAQQAPNIFQATGARGPGGGGGPVRVQTR